MRTEILVRSAENCARCGARFYNEKYLGPGVLTLRFDLISRIVRELEGAIERENKKHKCEPPETLLAPADRS